MGLLGDAFSIVGALKGNSAAKKKNKLAEQEMATQRLLADQQIDISKYTQGLSKDLMAQGTNAVDPYGGTSGYDPITGTYRSTLGAVPARAQGASDAEEYARLTTDMAMRRNALQDAERSRQEASSQATQSIGDLDNYRRGIGAVDPASIASQLRLDRTAAVNAGYDDAARTAQTMQLRTGSSAIGDALTTIARNRVRDQSSIGSPEVEALGMAEQINSGRKQQLASMYDLFSNKGSQVYDSGYAPTTYAASADAKIADQQKLNLARYEVAQGGSSSAAAGIGNAANGLRQGFQTTEAGKVFNPTGQMLGGFGKLANSYGDELKKLYGKFK